MSYATENQNNEKTPLHMEEWRLPYTFESALRKEIEPYIMGKLRKLCESVKISVVFLYEKNVLERYKDDKLSENAIEIINDEFMKDYANPVCVKLRENEQEKLKCDNQDKEAYKILFDYYYNGVDKDKKDAIGRLKLSAKSMNETQYFTYICRVIDKNFEEWIIPIFVGGKFCGAFITGQFENKSKSFDEGVFFTEIASIQGVINSFYNNANETHEQKLRKRLTDMVWGKHSLYEDVPEIKAEDVLTDEDIIERLKASRSHLFDCVICMRKIFKLKDIILYKPISNFTEMEKEITIKGGNLNENDVKATIKIKGDGLKYNRGFTPSDYELRHQIITDSDNAKSGDNEQIITVVEEDEKCRQWLSEKNEDGKQQFEKKIPQDLLGYFLCVYAMKGYPKYPVGYLLKFENDDVEEIELKKHEIERCFERITSVFLAQWVMNYSAYYKLLYKDNNANIERVTRDLRHELGQSYMGFLANIKYFEKNVSDLLHRMYYNPQSHNKLIQNIIKNSRSFARQSMARVDITRYMSGIPEPDREFFYPYGEILYKWSEIYQDTVESHKLKFNIIPLVKDEDGRYIEDETRPKMCADLDMIEQITFNLTTNAVKYSVPGTTITLDARLNEDQDKYQIIVSSYGFPMQDESEYGKVFDRGFQGSNIKSGIQKRIKYNKDSGGVGLAISKDIAEKHGGTLDLKHKIISSLCVPYFHEYHNARAKPFFKLLMEMYKLSDEFIYREIKEEENRIGKNSRIWNEITAIPVESTDDNVITPSTVTDTIKKGIVKYTFILSIPHNEKNESEVNAQ